MSPQKKAPKKQKKPPAGLAAPTPAEEGEPPFDEGGPHQDDEGGWHDLDDPPVVGGPHVDPDDSTQVYDEDEPRYSDTDEGWDDDQRDD